MKEMKMNWIKINTEAEDKYNLPNFKVTVLLAEKRPNMLTKVATGYLKSIDIQGPHWANENNPLANMFNGILGDNNANVFHPTHYCEIDTPED
jgi:hypothetical protein